ncbi:hypothetical protein [Coxiella endosymbiont of Ornithodoros maritimus]|uniref:hypothetical protein n=1 Tax=Coxiella endosymbiont of Ornithodoros maritimus TaxID=1656172 RepID=UPI002264623C|nr:hypothetical protein [Coxiella endosymbiont of Ornithodoros maritimus]
MFAQIKYHKIKIPEQHGDFVCAGENSEKPQMIDSCFLVVMAISTTSKRIAHGWTRETPPQRLF